MRWLGLSLLLLLRTCLAEPAFGEVRAAVTPRDVVVHVVTAQEYARRCPPATIACSQPRWSPCAIWLTEGFTLWGDPLTQRAGFDDPLRVAELAHELLHCVRGSWHPE